MDVLELAMLDELYKTNFCFPRYDLYDTEKNYDYSKKFYAFDCGIGSFCCYAEKENIFKIIDIATKYKLEDIFLEKSFDKTLLLNFKQQNLEEIRKIYNCPNDHPVVFWFKRGYNEYLINSVSLRQYLEL